MKKLGILGLILLSLNTMAATGGSCHLAEESNCIDYTGEFWAQNQSTVSESCLTGGGVYAATSCVLEGKVGGCLMFEDQGIEHTINFYQPYSSTDAQTGCQLAGGKWL